ncbi:HPr family phosphocarrier protein [Nocardiopsis ansamitocini]|uniref:Phosphocarrier protein HPr n=1 Tax=Nocardiopsis ansamitocini TaxID=1670832 RepID=A0A9W6P8S7_9ACTN|nr:HPr family phosphocarrier protein [Nocardiopsis ansamitocini]GLU49679.1 phosphocarrier protein [Nocardiopsis ansamitocini]
MAERRVKIESKVGLHARPASLFVKAASAFDGDVHVAKGDAAPVSAKSILGVMSLGAKHGDEIVVTAEGEGAEALLDTLAEIANAD